jgi:hypothetical protein
MDDNFQEAQRSGEVSIPVVPQPARCVFALRRQRHSRDEFSFGLESISGYSQLPQKQLALSSLERSR